MVTRTEHRLDWVRTWLRFLGIDRAVFYSVLARGLGALTSPISLFFVATFLTQVEQGYYYTFSSLLGLTIFLNLGLSNVLLLFASHEKASLRWTSNGNLEGDPAALQRLAALFRLGSSWFGIAGGLVLFVIFPLGLWFLSSQQTLDAVNWRGPWFAATLVTAAQFTISPTISILEGCGKVSQLRFLGLLEQCIGNPLFWLALWMGLGLYAGPVLFGTSFLVAFIWVLIKHRPLLRTLLHHASGPGPSLRHEVWPLQWRTAVGWMSGYFAFQLFNPMLFSLQGPEMAGRMGMSLTLTQIVGGIGLIWISNLTPRMGELWARQRYKDLDELFLFALRRVILFTVMAGLIVWLAVCALPHFAPHYAARILSPIQFGLLMAVIPFNNLVFAESFYLRANKQEPLLWASLCYGLAILCSNGLLGSMYGAEGMVAGYLVIATLNAAVCTAIYMRCRRRWQIQPSQDHPNTV